MLADTLIVLAAFALVSAVAGLLGAPDLGTSLAWGQIGFAVSLVYVLLRR